MGGRSRPKERKVTPVRLDELKIGGKKKYGVFDCENKDGVLTGSQISNLNDLGIYNANELYFRTNQGFSRFNSEEQRNEAINCLCCAFGYSPSVENLVKIRDFAFEYLPENYLKGRVANTRYLLDVEEKVQRIRCSENLESSCS